MTALSPTPSSSLRTVVRVEPDGERASAWPLLEAAAFAEGGRELIVHGRALFVFGQPLNALKFCLSAPQVAACRLAMHVGDVREAESTADRRAAGVPAITATMSGEDQLDRLLAGCGPGQRLLSRPAAALVRRAVQGQAITMPDTWDVRLDDREGSLSAVALDPPNALRDQAGAPVQRAAQPLPSRPNWWVERVLADAGPLQRSLLRNHKNGLRALLQVGDDVDGLMLLRAQRDALRIDALAALSLPLGDGELDAPPGFLVSDLGDRQLLADRIAEQAPSREQASVLWRALVGVLRAAHEAGCAHGALDAQAIALAADDDLRLFGLASFSDPTRRALAQRDDCRAAARIGYQLLVGAADADLDPFWQRRLDDPILAALLAACLDPEHPAPVVDLFEFSRRLDSASAATGMHAEVAPAGRMRWWRGRAR